MVEEAAEKAAYFIVSSRNGSQRHRNETSFKHQAMMC